MADATKVVPEAPQAPTSINTDSSGVLVIPSGGEMLRVGILGALVGLFVPGFAWLLQQFFLTPVFCHGQVNGVCAPHDLTAYYIGTVVAAVIAVALLANWQIFRPLLIAVAAAAALWGLSKYVGDVVDHGAWEYVIGSILLYAAAYLLFYWLLRLRSFAFSVILVVLAVVLVRWSLLV